MHSPGETARSFFLKPRKRRLAGASYLHHGRTTGQGHPRERERELCGNEVRESDSVFQLFCNSRTFETSACHSLSNALAPEILKPMIRRFPSQQLPENWGGFACLNSTKKRSQKRRAPPPPPLFFKDRGPCQAVRITAPPKILQPLDPFGLSCFVSTIEGRRNLPGEGTPWCRRWTQCKALSRRLKQCCGMLKICVEIDFYFSCYRVDS